MHSPSWPSGCGYSSWPCWPRSFDTPFIATILDRETAKNIQTACTCLVHTCLQCFDTDGSASAKTPGPSPDKLAGLWQKGHSTQKWRDDGVPMGWRPDALSVRLPVIFPCTTKSRRWQAITQEVDKGCSEFCVTVGTVTRNASILIHRLLKAMVVNLSWPSGRLWLYTGLTGSNKPRWLKAQ